MTVICLEGASAVGKSATSKYLESEYGFQIIPEVNKMFVRPKNETATWYLEKQIDRLRLAEKISSNKGIAVLDGDPMQPLWYNKIYEHAGLQPIEVVIDFYMDAVINDEIRFPDKYFILTIDELELGRRKSNDKINRRSNFVKHLKLIKPQLAYFQSMKIFSNESVKIIEAIEPSLTAAIIANNLTHSQPPVNQKALLLNQCQFLNEMI